MSEGRDALHPHGAVHFFSDHPKLGGLLALLAFGTAFSQKLSTSGVWLCMGFASLMLVLWIHELSAKRKSVLITLYALPLVGTILLYGWWLTSPPLLPVVFRLPQTLGWYERLYIRSQMTGFNQYLRDLGFDLPGTLPSVGLGELPVVPGTPQGARRGVAVAAGNPAEYSWVIILGPDSALDAVMITNGYCGQIFFKLLDVLSGRPDMVGREVARATICNYLTYSYLDYLGNERNTPWVAAMWDIRQYYGREFMDRSLVYSYRLFDDVEDASFKATGDAEFNNYFGRKVMRGISQMDLTEQTEMAVTRILEAHGIHLTSSSVVAQ